MQKHLGIGVRILTGFLIVIALMVSLVVIGLRNISEANQRLKDIIENNDVKTDLATTMQRVLRERALSMHALSILTDPFDKDDEVQRFNAYGSAYVEARQRFEAMPNSPEERALQERIRVLTREAQSAVQAVVDMSIEGKSQNEIIDQIRNVAMPMQREIAGQLDSLVKLQREYTDAAVRDAAASYVRVRNLMLGLGAVAFVSALAIATLVSRRVTLQAKQLATQALFDTLTGLPNRALLYDRLEQEIAHSLRTNTGFAIVLIDLDRFKYVNDTLGHEVGDELLREMGRRLQQASRAEDTVARLGGDEYVVLLHGVDAIKIPAVAEKLLRALEQPLRLADQSIDISGSMGIALFPEHGENASPLIRHADIAMYVAKRAGKGYTVYSFDEDDTSRNSLSFKSELLDAIQHGQLRLYYQPRIKHKQNCIIGVEALVRWEHPQHGFLPPDQFIPLAEDSGLIGALTEWVLKTALYQAAIWHDAGHLLSVSVNLSARNLHDVGLPATILGLLRKSGVEPGKLTLEITESAVMSNPADGLRILRELDQMGVEIAIDDFGTGYSSLAYLKQLPVDELKIDKSFVMEMNKNENDAVIVRSTIDLAHNLGLKVTAEGVEDMDIWNALATLGCDTSQGYFMCKPLPADQLTAWLDASPWAKSGADPLAVDAGVHKVTT